MIINFDDLLTTEHITSVAEKPIMFIIKIEVEPMFKREKVKAFALPVLPDVKPSYHHKVLQNHSP